MKVSARQPGTSRPALQWLTLRRLAGLLLALWVAGIPGLQGQDSSRRTTRPAPVAQAPVAQSPSHQSPSNLAPSNHAPSNHAPSNHAPSNHAPSNHATVSARVVSTPRAATPRTFAVRSAQYAEVPAADPGPQQPAASDPGSPPLELPQPANRFKIPLTSKPTTEKLEVIERNGLVSLAVRDATLGDVLAALAEAQRLNIVCGDGGEQRISLTLQNVPLDDALTAIVSVAGYTWAQHKGIVYVTSVSNATIVSPETQGRRIEVFPLHFAAADDLQESVQSMLSPSGKVFVTKTDPENNRKTSDALVVEDVPAYLERVTEYILQMDIPPRQVLIEAHILEVELSRDNRRGVNWEYVMNVGANTARFAMKGFANPNAAQAVFFQVDGGDLNGLIECLTVTNDAKTLASPRVMVLNGQRARILIGEKLGYLTTTVTQTSTQQNVSFLNVGVVFEVTPRITPDNRVLMQVRPEVSSGKINAETKLPDTKSTEVETNVMLDDGQGIVIGGLIRETDNNQQSKLAYLSDIRYLGGLFQHRVLEKQRSEVVIAIVPRVVPFDFDYQQQSEFDAMRATTPLLEGSLHRYPRPFEPQLPDYKTNPRTLRPALDGHGAHRANCRCRACLNYHPTQPQYQFEYRPESTTGSTPAEVVTPPVYDEQVDSRPPSRVRARVVGRVSSE